MALPCKFGNDCQREVGGKFVFANADPKNPLADPRSIAMVAAITVCNQNLCDIKSRTELVGGFDSSPFSSGFNRFENQANQRKKF